MTTEVARDDGIVAGIPVHRALLDGKGGEVLVARVRPKAGVVSRCSRCQRHCPGYDTAGDPRRWRGLDLGTTRV
ncbi:MAG: hypothetical protein ACRDSL_13475 [Pseudonocardiaceae bacterium]